MSDIKFDHIGLVETRRRYPSLQEDTRIPPRFQGHFMSQQIDSITACHQHTPSLGPLKYGGTSSISMGNIMGRKNPQGENLPVLAY